MKKQNFKTQIFAYLFLTALLVVILFPLVYVVLSSFKTNSEILAHPEHIIPREFTLDNYIQAWNSSNFSIKTMFLYSVYYTLVTVAIVLFTSALSGYVFARGRFKGKKLIFGVFTALMFVSLGSITMYPYFEILDFIKLEKSLHSLLFIKIFSMPIINVYLVKGFIANLPKEMDEAAKIDGCSFVQIFFYVILPLIIPIMATIGILSFQGSWNDYLNPMIFTMTKPRQQTLIVGVVNLKSSGEAASSWNLMLAGTTIALIPVLVAYSFGSKFFIKGITDGAVKG